MIGKFEGNRFFDGFSGQANGKIGAIFRDRKLVGRVIGSQGVTSFHIFLDLSSQVLKDFWQRARRTLAYPVGFRRLLLSVFYFFVHPLTSGSFATPSDS